MTATLVVVPALVALGVALHAWWTKPVVIRPVCIHQYERYYQVVHPYFVHGKGLVDLTYRESQCMQCGRILRWDA